MATNQQKIDQAFDQFNQKIEEVRRALPTILANEALNETLDNFKNQSFNGIPWQKRKDRRESRNLLVKSGALRRSPQTYAFRSNGFTLGSDLPYGAVHNYGLEIIRTSRSETFVRNRVEKGIKKGRFKKGTNDGQGFTFKAFKYNMTKRQFIGDSVSLRKRLNNAALEEYRQIMNK